MRLRGSDALILDGEFMHMRCAAHIMNLIVKDGLQEISASVEAIRNAVTYLRSSTPRFNSFELRVDTGKVTRGSLPLDITTRWNSTHLMLTMTLKYKQSFERMRMEDKLYCDYFEEFEGANKRVGPPVPNDWDEVQRLVKFLTIFRHGKLIVSGSNYVNSPSCYNEIVTIETNLITLSEKGSNELLKKKAMDMRYKFDKYWQGFENINKLLIVASVLDPTKKMLFVSLCLDELYGKESAQYRVLKDSIYDVMHKLFAEYNARMNKPSIGISSQSQNMPMKTVESNDDLEIIDDEEYKRMDSVYEELVKKEEMKMQIMSWTSI